ncbi:MAG: hypothetical protein ACM34K_00645 [Bacillota bacterium]
MVEMIFETIFEPVFFTVGYFLIILFTLGKQPNDYVKERYRVPIESLGGAVSIIITFLILDIIF